MAGISDLSLDRLHEWSKGTRYGVLAGVFLFVLFFCYYFFISGQMNRLNALKAEEQSQRFNLESLHTRLVKMKQNKEAIAKIKIKYKDLLDQLPPEAKIPNLLESISAIGVESGLRVDSFDPAQETVNPFYIVLPISMTLIGDYHQAAVFINRIAKLNRMITFERLTLQHGAQEKRLATGNKPLALSLLIYTYYQNPEEANSESEPKKLAK